MGAVLVAGPGGSNLYYEGPARQARSHRQRLSRRHLQGGGRALHPQRHVARGARGATRRWPTRCGRAGSRTCARRGPRRSSPPTPQDPARHRRRRRRHGAGRRCRRGWSTGSATAPPSAGASPRSPAVADEAVPGSFRAVDYEAWVDEHPASDEGGEIGVLTVAGEIVDGEAALGTAGAETIVRALDEGLERRNLQGAGAPGRFAAAARCSARSGSAGRCSAPRPEGMPVVVSMGSVAASGGYWVATAGDTIFAEPSTITGSIGVFGILPSFEGTLDQARPRRRRGQDDAAVGRAGPAARPRARGRPAAADGRRRHLPPLPRPGLAGAQAAGGASRTRSPRAGSGTAAPPASSGSSTRSAARRRGRRGGAAGQARPRGCPRLSSSRRSRASSTSC